MQRDPTERRRMMATDAREVGRVTFVVFFLWARAGQRRTRRAGPAASDRAPPRVLQSGEVARL